MQNTRLNNLVNGALARFGRWFANPWRHLSLVLMSLLLGTFLGSAIPATAGQAAKLDLVGAGVLILFTEMISWIVYGKSPQGRPLTENSRGLSLLTQVLNAMKIGMTYSMFVEAFKLGS